MSSRKKRCMFIDDAAELDVQVDGTQEGDHEVSEDEDEMDEETEKDREFIDDAPTEDLDDDQEYVEITKEEKLISRDDIRLVKENAGLCAKTRKNEFRQYQAAVYKDSDESSYDSSDMDGFVVESKKELAKKTRRCGLPRAYRSLVPSLPPPSLPAPSLPAPPGPAPRRSIVPNFSLPLDDSPAEDESGDKKEIAFSSKELVASPAPVRIRAPVSTCLVSGCMNSHETPRKKKAPPYKVGRAKSMIVNKKICPIFTQGARPAPGPSAKDSRKPAGELAVGIILKDGKLFYRDSSGKTSPREW
jgi:hypothetical protein